MVNVVLFPGNIKFNHSVGVANVIYCNGRVRVAGIMVKIVLNIPQSLRELRTVGSKKPGKLSFIRFNISSPLGSKCAFILSCRLNANRMVNKYFFETSTTFAHVSGLNIPICVYSGGNPNWSDNHLYASRRLISPRLYNSSKYRCASILHRRNSAFANRPFARSVPL